MTEECPLCGAGRLWACPDHVGQSQESSSSHLGPGQGPMDRSDYEELLLTL